MKNNKLQDLSIGELKEKFERTKTSLKAIAILHGFLMLVLFGYYTYQGTQRGFDDVKGLKNDFLWIAAFQLFFLLLHFLSYKNIEKELYSRRDR